MDEHFWDALVEGFVSSSILNIPRTKVTGKADFISNVKLVDFGMFRIEDEGIEERYVRIK